MTRTLACLVASMTVGAGFLNWMKPIRPAGASPGIELIARGPTGPMWEGIDVEICMPGDHLAPESHFLIYGNGAWQQTEHWIARKPLGRRALVRIAMLADDSLGSVTAGQRSAALTLARQLQEQYDIPGEIAIP